MLVCYLPVGSEIAAKYYAQCAIDAGVAFVNALPVFIASDPEWAAKFEAAGVPIVGDDIKSQVGATITHRVLAKLFEDRGVVLDRTYQLNVGGNMDFKNMLERERLESKKLSKTQAVTSNLTGPLGGKKEDRNVHIGPSDYVAWLDDRKWAYVRLEGRAFGEVPLNLEYKLEVWDSPNSAGIIIDAVRAAKIAKDRGIGGPILSASTYFMKSPPVQMEDTLGRAAARGLHPRRERALSWLTRYADTKARIPCGVRAFVVVAVRCSSRLCACARRDTRAAQWTTSPGASWIAPARHPCAGCSGRSAAPPRRPVGPGWGGMPPGRPPPRARRRRGRHWRRHRCGASHAGGD